jgi:integrase
VEDIIMARKNKNHHMFQKNGWWYFQMKGVKVSLHTTSVTEARRLRDKHYRDMLAHGRILEEEGRAVPVFGELAVKWFKLNKNKLRKSTIGDYRNSMNNFLLPKFGNVPIDRVQYLDIETFKSDLKRKNKRIINILVPMRNVFKLALKAGFIEKNPMDLLDPIKAEKPEINPFSFEEVMAITENVDPHYTNFFTVAFFTGMRFGEMAALKWKNVDFKMGLIKVREALVRDEEGLPKTEGSIRDIKMLPMVLEAMRDQRNATFGKSPYVFLNRYGRTLKPCPLRKHAWMDVLEKLGLEYRTMMHTRHTFITMMLDSGEHIGWVARQVGHTSAKMIFERYYSYIENYQTDDGQKFMDRVYNARLNAARAEKVTPFLPHLKNREKDLFSNWQELFKKTD